MSFRMALLAGVALAIPAAVQAQPVQGLYVGAGIGWNQMLDSDITLNVPGQTGAQRNGSARFESGWGVVASLGWGFGNGLRAEAEVNYRDNAVHGVNGFGFANWATTGTGSARSYGVMGNAFYDFHMGWPVVPYVGVGIGYVGTDYDGVRQISRSTVNVVQIPGHDWNFAYQGIVGVAVPLDTVTPGLSLTVEYRYFATLDPSLDAYVWTSPGRQGGTADVQNANQSILLGFRYAFNTPTPPPPVAPAAAPAPARTFLVFFDWDRADLTDRARQIIAEAATNAQRVGTTRIEVSGHADRSGTPQYNQRLSERRANAVAAELERRGVPRSAMVIQAFGESRPLVPTADGVREPQNRRVEIILR
jgi:outer membrane protein OmpA-like peptidoglycan-associated protein